MSRWASTRSTGWPGPGAEEAAELADQLKVEVQQSLADVRRLVEDLRPPDLDQLGLVGALRHQAGKVTERDPGLEVEVVGEDLPSCRRRSRWLPTGSPRRRSPTSGRHAAARTCQILLAMDDAARLRVEIEDDGVGLHNGRPGGVGLTAMRERATELGGSFRVCRREQGGTLVTARLPVGGAVIRVVLVDDHPVFRHGLRALLGCGRRRRGGGRGSRR